MTELPDKCTLLQSVTSFWIDLLQDRKNILQSTILYEMLFKMVFGLWLSLL